MANDDHINILRRGKQAWNDWRRENTEIVPDLEDADFRKANLKAVDMNSAHLARTDFSKTDLRRANFDKALMRDADLTGARLFNSTFKGAALSGADLGGARVPSVRLASAKTLFRTQPPPPEVLANELYPISSTDIFIKKVNELLWRIRRDMPDRVVYYRGEKCDHWKLASELSRKELQGREAVLLEDMELAEPGEFANDSSAIGRLILARHYGLPTRVLDLTRNPLVALYFAAEQSKHCGMPVSHNGKVHMFIAPTSMVKPATSDTVSVVSSFALLRTDEQHAILWGRELPGTQSRTTGNQNKFADDERGYDAAMKRLHHFIAREKPYFEPRIDPRDFLRVIVVEPKAAFPRIRAQSGAFLISAFHEKFDVRSLRNGVPNVPHYSHYVYSVPHDKKPDIRRQLGYLNVNKHTLFPGLEGAAKELTREALTPRRAKPWWADGVGDSGD